MEIRRETGQFQFGDERGNPWIEKHLREQHGKDNGSEDYPVSVVGILDGAHSESFRLR